ncbi:hypothetical protein Csa_015219 [Cucumis sativus]|uniref:Uncharacterized protein n=1 Tax=Cucumis sativus TaxID=3659 RepID=A0A0A0KZY7_CUCSA|nr:hypothetical protein Csa_015219 [Cucumis sativus]
MRRKIRSPKALSSRPEPLPLKSSARFARYNLQIRTSWVIIMAPNIQRKSPHQNLVESSLAFEV